jgi:hypothetical protein
MYRCFQFHLLHRVDKPSQIMVARSMSPIDRLSLSNNAQISIHEAALVALASCHSADVTLARVDRVDGTGAVLLARVQDT